MRKQRGGIMLFVVVMVGLMTAAILATVQLGTAAGVVQARREADAKARYAVDGAIEQFLCELRDKAKSLPTTTSYAVGVHTVSLTATDNSANIARTVAVAGTTKIQGRTYKVSRVVGNREDPNPLSYALFINSGLDPKYAITLGSSGANGDLWVNGSIVARSNPFTINGDLESVGSTLPVGASITGNTIRGETALPYPTPSGVIYLAAASVNLALGTLNGFGFAAPGTHYPLMYRLGNLDLQGSFSGKGTIFVTGDVNVKANVTYANASSRLVVIALGAIKVDNVVTQMAGFYFAGGQFKTGTAALAINTGAVAADNIDQQGPLTIVHDPTFWNDPSEGVKHRVPGLWP